ncbi:5654_t:CDS:2 [Entrophospora sp. SA101]|nr:5654_t:CDS:2 [Entrophospora sp. SA101]
MPKKRFNNANYNSIDDDSDSPLKSSDFLPSKTRNLTLMSTLSSEIRLEKNLIFIGDIHGSLDELKSLIKVLNYNPNSDHLIFVGDLIIKGPKSIEVLRYLQPMGVSVVRGNHEDKVLRWKQFLDDLKIEEEDEEEVVDKRLKEYFQEKNLPIDEEIVFKSEHKLVATKLDRKLHDYILSFPIIYDIPNLDVYVVHGGLLPEKSLWDQDPFDIMNMEGVPWSGIWNKVQKESINPKYIIYGHVASRGLDIKKYSFGLDSGCVKGRMLTALKWNKNATKQRINLGPDVSGYKDKRKSTYNGQKAQHKRERNQKTNGAKNTSSQLKANEAARTVICQVCRNTFLCTIRAKALVFNPKIYNYYILYGLIIQLYSRLSEHADNKHSKTLQDCFPGFVEIPKK